MDRHLNSSKGDERSFRGMAYNLHEETYLVSFIHERNNLPNEIQFIATSNDKHEELELVQGFSVDIPKQTMQLHQTKAAPKIQ